METEGNGIASKVSPGFIFFFIFVDRGVPGTILHHAGGGRDPVVLHGAGAGAVPSQGRDHLLG